MIHISKVDESNTVRLVVTRQLKELGLKLPRKLSLPLAMPLGVGKPDSQLGLPLISKYFKKKVHVTHGIVKIPKILHDTVTFLQHHLHTEGLFRKTGSLSRQRELLSFMDRGAMIPGDSHTHDVANLMKRFFRELPEPLLTNRLLSCFEDAYNMFHTDKEKFHKVVLLLCLLLPQDHRHTLEWTSHFMASVAANSDHNKMDIDNLATVLSPNIMRCTKIAVPTRNQLRAYKAVVIAFIEVNELIGYLPQDVYDSITRLSLHRCRNESEKGDDEVKSGEVGEGSGEATTTDGKGLEELGAKMKRRKRRSGSLSGFISGIGHSLGRLAGSRKNGSRKLSRPTAMELHDRLIHVDNEFQQTEETEDREEDTMEVDSPLPQPRLIPILDGRSIHRATTAERVTTLVHERTSEQQACRSPGKRKATEEPGLFSASKRQAILRRGVLPSMAVNLGKSSSQSSHLMSDGHVTVTPGRVLRAYFPTPVSDVTSGSEMPIVECCDAQTADGCIVADVCNEVGGGLVPQPSKWKMSPHGGKKLKKPKKRNSGLFKSKTNEHEQSQDELTIKENSPTDSSSQPITPMSTSSVKKRPSLSKRLKRLSGSMFRSPARLIKSKSEDNLADHTAMHGVGARLAGATLSICSAEDDTTEHPCVVRGGTSNVLKELQSPGDTQHGRGLRRRSRSLQYLASDSSPVVQSVTEWII